MRILVMSDSHGDQWSLKLAVSQQPSADLIVFLGDGERDMEYITTEKPVIMVKGNCDFASLLPVNAVDYVGDYKLYCTHGYAELVKHGTGLLKQKAREEKAHIVLYGHTHFPVTEYDEGIYYVNPGSIRDGNYAYIDVTKSGIMPVLMKIRY